jgi:hypothetical protein
MVSSIDRAYTHRILVFRISRRRSGLGRSASRANGPDRDHGIVKTDQPRLDGQ